MLSLPLLLVAAAAVSSRLSAGLDASGGDSAHGPAQPLIQPNPESARSNAFHIFNAVHSAGRQWGSSLNHNGFGLIPAVIPRGTLLYHGARRSQPPKGFEWLAFEVEHAEQFAASMGLGPARLSSGADSGDGDAKTGGSPLELRAEQRPLSPEPRERLRFSDEDVSHSQGGYFRGYLQTYQAARDLNILYLDGVSAGKTDMGTLDFQDLVLGYGRMPEQPDRPAMEGEFDRASLLCELASEWGADGFMRMEIGFEVIYCNFTSGLDLLWATRTPVPPDTLPRKRARSQFKWVRAGAERYDGIGGGRVRFDFSSMASGFFFPIPIASTDPERPHLVRLAAASSPQRQAIHEYADAVARRPRSFAVDWQAVTDMIVTRFADKFALMAAENVTSSMFLQDADAVTLTYLDAPPRDDDRVWKWRHQQDKNRTADAIERCTTSYLKPAIMFKDKWELEDHLIFTAISSVMEDICTTVFAVRLLLLGAFDRARAVHHLVSHDDTSEDMEQAIAAGAVLIQKLTERLDWTRWKMTRPCAMEEVIAVAMWPFGNSQDHWNPGCRTVEQIAADRGAYWTPPF